VSNIRGGFVYLKSSTMYPQNAILTPVSSITMKQGFETETRGLPLNLLIAHTSALTAKNRTSFNKLNISVR